MLVERGSPSEGDIESVLLGEMRKAGPARGSVCLITKSLKMKSRCALLRPPILLGDGAV